MTTLTDWVYKTREHLDGNVSEMANQLEGAYVVGAGTITLRHNLQAIGPGALISIGMTTFRVISVNQISKQATVVVDQGTSDTAAADGAMVRVNPRFTDARIASALNAHLNSLSSPVNGLYAVDTIDLDYSPSLNGYDLQADVIDVLDVRQESYSGTRRWSRVESGDWDLIRDATITDFPSGIGLRLDVGNPGLTSQVVVAVEFTPIDVTNPAALVSTTGITSTMEDIPPLGAAIRLMAGKEVQRNNPDAQGDTRRAEEVPPLAVARSTAKLEQLWAQRVTEEALRLRRRYPVGT